VVEPIEVIAAVDTRRPRTPLLAAAGSDGVAAK
jgi:hypothetical protein